MSHKTLAKLIVGVVVITVIMMIEFLPAMLWTYFRSEESMGIVFEAILVNFLVACSTNRKSLGKALHKMYVKYTDKLKKIMDGERVNMEEDDDETGDHTERAADEVRRKETGKDLDS